MERAELAGHVARAGAGDRDAIAAVITAIQPAVFRYCRARLRTREQAEDVAQEVGIAVITALARYQDTGAPFEAFVFGIASRQVALAYRRQGRASETLHAQVPEQADLAAGPSEQVERLDDIADAQRLLELLPEQQREILRLRVAAGLSTEEVAAVLGMTPGAVRVAQHRALTRLRTHLATQEQP